MDALASPLKVMHKCFACIHGSILQVPLSAEERQKQEQTPEKLAIGGDSGFQVDGPAHSIDKLSELVLLGANIRVPLPCLDLPEVIINAVEAIQVCQHVSGLKFFPLAVVCCSGCSFQHPSCL